MKPGTELIAIERKRQIEELGFDYSNDDLYADEQLAKASAIYALPKKYRGEDLDPSDDIEYDSLINVIWPWNRSYWKPTPEDRIKELVKAGALIAAQIDYLQNNKK